MGGGRTADRHPDRRTPRRSKPPAAARGAQTIGHTAALLAVAVVLIALEVRIPPALGLALELGVALMLIALGASLLRALWCGGPLHMHAHEHGARIHVHPHLHDPLPVRHAGHSLDGHGHHVHRTARPVLVGMVHGLAGSAGLMLAVLATIPDPAAALGYVAAFGVGSVGGMATMSTLLGLPLAWAADRFRRLDTALRVSAAVASVGVGLWLAWGIGTEAGILA